MLLRKSFRSFNNKPNWFSSSFLPKQPLSTLQRTHLSNRTYSTTSLPPFSHTPQPYTGPSKEKVKQLRKDHMNPAMFLLYKDPIMLVEGKDQYLFDETGRRYLDLFGGIVTVSIGHSHPAVTEAATKQLNLIQHSTTIYLNNEVAEYAKELSDKLPDGLDYVYFVNSGSEATDLAMLMARAYTGNFDILALRNGYHGMSQGAMGITALSTWKYNTPQGFGIKHVMNPDMYRGPFANDSDPATRYADEVRSVLKYETSNNIAGWISETIQGVGGCNVPPEGYFQQVYDSVRNAGGVCIADEVQTGFGRCGTHYWGFETQGVLPDIVTMAKSIGNGYPLAAVVTTKEIAQSLTQKVHFNTYGGAPLASAVGRAVLKQMDVMNVQKNSHERGNQFIKGLKKLQEKYEVIGDIRGKGLMLAFEIVKDRDSKTPFPEALSFIFEDLREQSILIGKGGIDGNVFRLKPPMCITEEDVDYALYALDRSLEKLSRQ